MNARDAMREAHRIAADVINQARRSTTEGWTDDENDSDHIDSALGIIAQRHERAASKGDVS
jgi:hypothetical protein